MPQWRVWCVRLYALGFVLLLARAAADRLSGDSIFLSLRSLRPVVLMSVSGVHSPPRRRRGLFVEVPLWHQSSVFIRWWPFCWLTGDPGLCPFDLQFSTKEWHVCILVGQFLCIRGCDEDWPLEIGFWEACPPMNSASHTFAGTSLDGRCACPSLSPWKHPWCTPQRLY